MRRPHLGRSREREPESGGVEGRETDGQKEEGRDRWERRGGFEKRLPGVSAESWTSLGFMAG